MAHVDAALCSSGTASLRNRGQVQRRTNRRKACLIHGAAILRRDIYHQSLCARAGPSGQSVSKLLLVKFLLFRGFASSGGCFSFQSSSRDISIFILWRTSAKYFPVPQRNNHALSSFFCSDKIPSTTSPLSLPSLSSSRSRFGGLMRRSSLPVNGNSNKP